MKKINLGFSVPVLCAFVLFSCGKKEPNVAPTTDTEVQTAIDASWATFMVSDVDMIASFGGENYSKPGFYNASSASTGTTYIVRNLQTNRISINFNNTLCLDGHVRDGSIFMFYKEFVSGGSNGGYPYLQYPYTGNENYTRDYNFTGRITLEEYKVDGWLMDDKDFSCFIKNLRPNDKTPVSGNLQWSFEGEFKLKKNQDSMSWKGKLIKTLENTADPKVFATNAQAAIVWSLATISYTGSATGTTPGNAPFSYSIYQSTPVKRDFTCFPDKIANVTLTNTLGINPEYSEFHPFKEGVAAFTPGTAYPREIYYDNSTNTYGGTDAPITLSTQCDNKAVVQIKGIYYTIDMKK